MDPSKFNSHETSRNASVKRMSKEASAIFLQDAQPTKYWAVSMLRATVERRYPEVLTPITSPTELTAVSVPQAATVTSIAEHPRYTPQFIAEQIEEIESEAVKLARQAVEMIHNQLPQEEGTTDAQEAA